MSTIKVENIRIASEAASRPVTGVAAAWVNFNGIGTVAISDGANVSSITDSSTGVYIVVFSNAMANSSYATSSSTWQAEDVTGTGANFLNPAASSSTGQFIENDVPEDPIAVSIIYHGELA